MTQMTMVDTREEGVHKRESYVGVVLSGPRSIEATISLGEGRRVEYKFSHGHVDPGTPELNCIKIIPQSDWERLRKRWGSVLHKIEVPGQSPKQNLDLARKMKKAAWTVNPTTGERMGFAAVYKRVYGKDIRAEEALFQEQMRRQTLMHRIAQLNLPVAKPEELSLSELEAILAKGGAVPVRDALDDILVDEPEEEVTLDELGPPEDEEPGEPQISRAAETDMLRAQCLEAGINPKNTKDPAKLRAMLEEAAVGAQEE